MPFKPPSGGGSGTPAGLDTELQYNNAGSFGGTTDLLFLAGQGLIAGGPLAIAWDSTLTSGAQTYTQSGGVTPQGIFTINERTETVGTDVQLYSHEFSFDPTEFRTQMQFTSSDFPATDIGYKFVVNIASIKYELKTEGATGPLFILDYDTTTQAANDVFEIDFLGRDDGGADNLYSSIKSTVIASTAAAEVGRLSLSSSVAGVDTVGLYVQNGQAYSTTGSAGAPSFSVTADGLTGIYCDGTNSFAITAGGTRRFSFLGSQIRGNSGTAAAPTYSWIGDTDTGMFLGGTNALSFTTAGTTKIQINGNTNIEAALQLSFTATTTPTITINAIGRGATGMLYNSPTGSSHIQTINGVSAFTVNGVGEAVKVTDTITASVTQTQGQQPLVSSYNIVTVVANANDTVTLPSAITGQTVRVKNEGANTLQVFPALGDSVNNGAVDASVTQAAATFYMYIADDATNWTRLQLTIA